MPDGYIEQDVRLVSDAVNPLPDISGCPDRVAEAALAALAGAGRLRDDIAHTVELSAIYDLGRQDERAELERAGRLLSAGARRHLDAIRAATRHLNQPMLNRLRLCAADTSSNYDGRATVYPPEAQGLIALADAADAMAGAPVLEEADDALD